MARRMPLLIALLVLALAPAAALAGPGPGYLVDAPTAKERRAVCRTAGETVLASPRIRVFRVDDGPDHAVYACWRPTGRLQLLTGWYGDDPAPRVRLAGRRAVEVVEGDLVTRRLVRRAG